MSTVRYTKSSDGTALAWTKGGQGPVVVKASNWLTHLEYDLESPIWSHWIKFLEQRFTTVRYDERGCGLSDRRAKNLTLDHWVADLEAVVEASNVEKPFYLLGISQGAATSIAYAIKNPEDVAGLILVGGYARGSNHRGPLAAELYSTVINVFKLGWQQNNPAFQDVFTSRFIPDAPADQRRWFTDLCQATVSPETGAELLMARAEVNVEDMLSKVTVPTWIFHTRDDQVIPFEEGQILAQGIPNAQFKSLDGKNHIIQEAEPAWKNFCQEILGLIEQKDRPSLEGLTGRELQILKGICNAQSNKEIARDLDVSEKTVRNHISNLFSKLGVGNRQQALKRFGQVM